MSVTTDPVIIGWLSGVIDSDGCIDRSRANPRVRIKQADLDLVIRASAAMGCRYYADTSSHRGAASGANVKPLWVAQCTGERAVEVMRAILPHLSARRTLRVTEILRAYDTRTPASRTIQLVEQVA